MAKDFLDELSKTAQSLTEKVSSVYESSKLRSKIAAEENQAEKLMAEIGKIIYTRFMEGKETDSEFQELCEAILGHKKAVDDLKAAAAGKKGLKICPACEKEIDKDAMFCPYCGTPVPNPEPEQEDEFEDTEDGAAEEDACEVTEAVEETEEPEESEEEAVEEPEKAEEAVSSPAEETAESVGETADTFEKVIPD